MRKDSIRGLLNIPEYKIIEIISKDDEEIHIRIEPYKRNYGMCPCGKRYKRHHSVREMVAEDLRLGERRVFLHILKRRYACRLCKKIKTEKIDWIEKSARVTKAFAKSINRLTAITTNQEAGWYLGLNDEKVYRIDKTVLEKQAKEILDPTPKSKNISVDEVAWKKNHRYLTNVIDVDEKVVTWNAKGRKAAVLDGYYESLGKKDCLKIESVALDGARTYISSTKKNAKKAIIVLDRFHMVQKINNTLDQLRKNELRNARKNSDEELVQLTGCKQRFILLKRFTNLTDRQSSTLKRLCEINLPIYKGLLLKEEFLKVYECANAEEAAEHLYNWIDQCLFSGIELFFELGCKIIDKMQYILNWFEKRISSAISEGFNNKIKRLKRMAYGYKDIEYFKLKIHQHCGYLNPRKYQLN